MIFQKMRQPKNVCQNAAVGPVMLIMTFDDEDEIIKVDNETTYGLATSIWTQDSSKLIRMINSIDAGIVWSNCVTRENVGVPVGGFK